MHLSDEAIERFMKIYEKKFGKKISKQDAMASAHKLVGLVKILFEHQNKTKK